MAYASSSSESTPLAWAGGIFLPLIMLAADPAVFRGDSIGEGPILAAFAPGCYCAMALGMLALGVQLLARPRSAVLAGVLAGAAGFAALLGLVLLPFSIFGLFVNGIGIFGFSPFLTALAIGWQANSARKNAAAQEHSLRFWLGAFLYFAGSAAVQGLAGPAYHRSHG